MNAVILFIELYPAALKATIPQARLAARIEALRFVVVVENASIIGDVIV